MKRATILIGAVAIIAFAVFMLHRGSDEKETAPQSRRIDTDQPEVMPDSEQSERGVLRLLIWEGHDPEAHVRRFEKNMAEKYGRKITLQISYLNGTDDFYDSIRSGTVDLVMLTHDLLKDERFNFISNRLLLPLDLKNIPNFRHVLPSLQQAEYLYDGGQVYACPESQGPYALAYNPSKLKEVPTSWNALWDPRYKGRYVIGGNEYIYNANITALALGYSREAMGDFDSLNNPVFRAKLRALAVNAHSFWHGVDKAEDLSGQALAAIWGDSLKQLKQQGEEWKLAEPVEGTPFWIDNCTITSALEDQPFLKKIAEEYINSLLSTEYQVGHILRVIQTMPIVTNIDPLLEPQEKARIYGKNPDTVDEKRVLLPTYSTRGRNGLRLLWEEAKEGASPEKNR